VSDRIRTEIRDGSFGRAIEAEGRPDGGDLTFGGVGTLFVESYSKAREKAAWDDNERMIRQIAASSVGGVPLGEKSVHAVTEADFAAFIQHLSRSGESVATRNHFVGILKTLSAWAVRKGYRATPMVTQSDIVRRRKAVKRNRRLEPGEYENLLDAAGPHLQRLIIAALGTCCRLGELLSLQWRDVSLARNEIHIRAENTKTGAGRTIPISTRLRAVLELDSGRRSRRAVPADGVCVRERSR
jgi:integrase